MPLHLESELKEVMWSSESVELPTNARLMDLFDACRLRDLYEVVPFLDLVLGMRLGDVAYPRLRPPR